MRERSLVRSVPASAIRAAAATGCRGGARFLLRNRFAIAFASLVWLIVRSGTQPRRMAYPCQRAAAANVSAFAIAAVAGMALPRGVVRRIARGRWSRLGLLAGVALVAALLVLPPLLRPAAPLALVQQKHLADAPEHPAAELATQLIYPSPDEALVSVAHDAKADYAAVSPFDEGQPADNAVYPLVRRAVVQLGLGPPRQPLKGFVEPGSRVLIKPNLEGAGPFQHTRACVVRPIIDMAIEAGAAEVIVADSSPLGRTQEVLEDTGYVKMVEELNARKPACKLAVLPLDNTPWSWVQLGKASAYAGSDIKDEDLCTGDRKTVYHRNADSHGRTTDGTIVGWHAIHDAVFDADVVISVPRLKIHGMMINTLAIKNLVGITVASTSGKEAAENYCRIAHTGSAQGPEHIVEGYGNDIAWRELADVNRALIYWKDGKLHDKPRRKLLCVLDAICCGDGSHGAGPKVVVGTVLASVDPIAIDAAGSRLMRYDFRWIPMVNNAPAVPSHPWGTNDPARVRLTGDAIGPETARRFSNPWDTSEEFRKSVIDDLQPPQATDVTCGPAPDARDRIRLWLDSADAAAVFVLYQQPREARRAARMARSGGRFTFTIPDRPTTYSFVLQDRFFNSITTPEQRHEPKRK